jgi:hypothetical protein
VTSFLTAAGQAATDAEGDGPGAHSRRPEAEARVASLADRTYVGKAGRRHEQVGPGVAHPERPQPLELIGEPVRHRIAGDNGIHVLHGDEIVRVQSRAGVGDEVRTKRGESFEPDLEANRHPMTAEADQVVLAGRKPRVQVVWADAPARAPSAPVTVECDEDGGAVMALHETGGDDPHDAGVPALAGEHEQWLVALLARLSDLSLGLEQDARLDSLAFRVHGVELTRNLPRAVLVGRQQKLEGRVCAV